MIKNKILTIFFILLFCLIWTGLLFPAQKRFKITLGVHGSGLWIPKDKTIRDIYGTNFYPIGFSFRAGIGENFAIEVSTDLISESGTPLTLWGEPSPYGTASMKMIPIQISGIYGPSLNRDFSYYIGAGFIDCGFEETLTLFGYSETASQTSTGFLILVGVQRFWKNFGAKAEIRYLSINIEGLQGEMDIGGVGIYGGFLVKFEF